MSYTPTQWATDDTVTAEKLNKMENGIASPIVTITRHIVAQTGVTFREYYTKSDVDKLTDAVILINTFDDPDGLSTYVVGTLTPYYLQSDGATLKDFNQWGEKSNTTAIRLNKSTNTLNVGTATFTYSADNDYYYHDVSGGGGND